MNSVNEILQLVEEISEENQDNLRRLVEQMQTRVGVIPFVGAGLSVPYGFPGWTNFLHSRARSIAITDQISQRIELGEYEEAAEDLIAAMGIRAFDDSLDRAYGIKRIEGQTLTGAMSVIPQLSLGPVITTNFDHALEEVFKQAGQPFDRAVWGAKSDLIIRAFHQDRRFLLKIHGDVEDRTDRILTRSEYQNHYGAIDSTEIDFDRLLPRLLGLILTSRPLLFLGCSLSVDRTVTLLGYIANKFSGIAHYAIVELPGTEDEKHKRARHLSELAIRPIWYPTARHDFIEPLLRHLAHKIKESAYKSGSYKSPYILPQLDTKSFTGRETELKDLEKLLVDRSGPKVCGIVGLSGTGGIGKSALAVHFAELHRADFPDGVIGLRVDGKDANTIAREFAKSFGEELDPDDDRDVATIMQEVFIDRRVLLIFDNADDASIRSLRPGGDRCAVIVTTRDRLLPQLLEIPDDSSIHLPPLSDLDALALLKRLLGTKRVEAEPGSASEIIGLVGNLPLALQIVGAALSIQDWRKLGEYAEALREERDRLSKLRIKGDPFLDVRASFALSLKLLEQSEIDFFACLSVCAQDGFSVQAAKAAAGSGDSIANESLGRLYQLSLLNRPQLGNDRFVFHPLIRLFAQELSAERSLSEEAARRHAEFYVELIRSTRAVGKAISDEMDDIVLAAEWLLNKGRADYEFLIRLEPFLQQYGYWQEAVTLMSGFLSVAEQTEDWTAVVQIRIQWAKYLSLRGDFASAEKSLESSAKEITKIEWEEDRQRCETMYLNTLGGILLRRGRFDEAEQVLRRSADIEEGLGRERGLSKALTSLGGVLQRKGHFKEAAAVFTRCAEIEERLNNTRGLAMALNSLGGVLKRVGRFNEAADAYQRGLNFLIKLDDKRGQAMVLNSLGGVLQRQGRFDEAVDAFQESYKHLVETGDERGQAMVLNSLGGALQRQGGFDEAIDAFRRSIDIGEKLRDRKHLAMVHTAFGRALLSHRDTHEAILELIKGFEIDESLRNRKGIGIVAPVLIRTLSQQNRRDEAIAFCKRALSISPKDERLNTLYNQLLAGNKI